MLTTRARVRTKVALVAGAVALVAALGSGTAGAATPTYQFSSHDSGALTGRVFSAAATETDGDAVVLYGGELPGDGVTADADTWVYRPSTGWVAKCGSAVAGATAPCGPGARATASMGSGPTGAVLFGGSPTGIDNGGGALSTDTWVWNGSAWTQVCAPGTCGPAGRIFPGMAGNGQQVVMFGGLTGSGVLDDTWVFDGTTWKQTCGDGLPAACGAPGLAGAAIGWDGTQFVMFGGAPTSSGGLGSPVDDTWTFDGTKWSQVCGASIAKPCGPTSRSLGTSAFQRHADASLQGMVMSGGGNLFTDQTQTLFRDAWFWHAGTWTQLTVPWNSSTVSFAGDTQPAVGSGPLLNLLAARPADCQVLVVGQNPVQTGANFLLAPQTYAGGWDLSASGAPSGCTAEPAGNPTGLPVTGATSDPSATSDATTPTSSIARTGRGSARLAIIGALAVIVGGAAIAGSRRKRRAVAVDGTV